MLDQEEYDGMEFLLESMIPVTGTEEVDLAIETELEYARADFAGWSEQNARKIRKGIGHRVVRFILNRHPAARGLSREDKDLLRGIGTGKVRITPENAKKWHDRISRWLPVLKAIAQFTPVPYNFAVIGLIVTLIIIDENRLKPNIVEAVCASLMAA